ncbi:YjbH domain-containing protein [Tateyamaria pelophila]|uniref:YjbH domain-containing protein n=1 Tax=Tateyamaria pelophila TaxID=328415 RepID=UPI001CBE7A37|nr:YjbH domain-containing protein [Tateyamaria pelophila]
MFKHTKKCAAVAALCLVYGSGWAEEQRSPSLTTYGTPGLVEMPTAEALNDGEFALTVTGFGPNLRTTAAFQILPRVMGSFRYSIINDFNGVNGNRYDRSFDLQFQLADEVGNRPAIAMGLRDIFGTGIYSSEYFVATKTITPRLQFTGGIGWGRLGGYGGFTNPLGFFNSKFDTRPGQEGSQGGELETGNWFRGDAAFFGGVKWDLNEQTSFFAEYSSDSYDQEEDKTDIKIKSPFNFGLERRFNNGITLKGFVIGTSEFGAQLSYQFDPAKRRYPGGREGAPFPVGNRAQLAAAEWNNSLEGGGKAAVERVLKARLADESMVLLGFELEPTRASITVNNERWDVEAEAVGRATRVMAATLPPAVEDLTVVLAIRGVPVSRVVTRRSDLEELVFDYDGSWRTLARAEIEDAYDESRANELSGSYPTFDYALTPYVTWLFFDPDEPIRADIGPQLRLALRTSPGLTFSGQFRYPLFGNIDKSDVENDSVLPPVRTDAPLYAKESDIEINTLTAEYIFRPAENVFMRGTAGYLEAMYGGLSAEVLWYPIDSRLALGAEVNYAKKRDFDMLLGFQNYDVVTGHASAYYDFGNGFQGQVDAGRYLAGDWGATFSIDRRFNNGFTVGAFFTQTNVSYEDFGEGSFDKGVFFEVPLSWITGSPSLEVIKQTIRPVLRDGGARLNVDNRLWGITRDSRGEILRSGWGRYLR